MKNASAAESYRRSRYVVETFTDPGQFPSTQDYRIALAEALIDLSRCFGVEPPDDVYMALGVAA